MNLYHVIVSLDNSSISVRSRRGMKLSLFEGHVSMSDSFFNCQGKIRLGTTYPMPSTTKDTLLKTLDSRSCSTLYHKICLDPKYPTTAHKIRIPDIQSTINKYPARLIVFFKAFRFKSS